MRLVLALLVLPVVLSAQLLPTPSTAQLDIAFRAMKFRCIGPYRAGRSLAVAGHQDLKSTYYFGATGGGVWKSEDSGDYHRPLGSECRVCRDG
jgi:hypothetical protein